MISASGIASLGVQFLVGVLDYLALNKEVEAKDEFLKDLLKVELIVQVVEFIFYVWLVFYVKRMSSNITPFRYIDWSITTPMMLITLSGFLNHDGTKLTRLSDFLYENRGSIIKIVLLNAAMLAFGLIGEFGLLNPYMAAGLGFIPLMLNFKHIKDEFLKDTEDKAKNNIFYWFVFFWSLYGVCAVMNHTNKNTGYNILDIFSKNFLGIFLGYLVWSKSNTKAQQSVILT